LSLFVFYMPMLLIMVLRFIKWTSRAISWMIQSNKGCMWSNHLVSIVKSILTMFINSIWHSMGLSKHSEQPPGFDSEEYPWGYMLTTGLWTSSLSRTNIHCPTSTFFSISLLVQKSFARLIFVRVIIKSRSARTTFLRLPSPSGIGCMSIWLCRLDSPILLHISCT
jgi:hypothetical protein